MSCASPVVADVHGRQRLFVITGGKSRPPTGGLMVMDPSTGALDFATISVAIKELERLA